MSGKRLLLIAISVLVCASLGFAQAPQNNAAEVQQFRLLHQHPEASLSSAQGDPTRIHVDPHAYWAGEKPDSEVLRFSDGLASPADVDCFSIRSYRVVRDSPDSDVTHRDGATTCVPAARFRVHTAVVHQP